MRCAKRTAWRKSCWNWRPPQASELINVMSRIRAVSTQLVLESEIQGVDPTWARVVKRGKQWGSGNAPPQSGRDCELSYDLYHKLHAGVTE